MEKQSKNRYRLSIVQTIFNSGVIVFPQEMFKKDASIKGFSVIFEFGDDRYPINVSAQRSVQEPGNAISYRGYRASLSVDLLNRISAEFPYSYMLNVGKQLVGDAIKESMTIKVLKDGDDYVFKVIDTEVFEHEVWTKLLPAIRKFVVSEQFETKKKKDKSESHRVFLQKFHFNIPIEEFKNYTHVKKALYMWIDKNRKKIYIGYTTNFVARFNQHIRNVSDPNECENYYGSEIDITHFSYWHVRNFVTAGMMKAFESAIIAMVASIIPNRSGCIAPFIEDTEWELVNNKYNQ